MNIENIDYSDVVVDKMREKYGNDCVRYTCMDMLNMTYEDNAFDVVIDKATMDVVMTDNKDPWNPTPAVKERAKTVLKNVYRVLKKEAGLFIQISFD